MEEAEQQDLFCIQCKLQFGKKLVFDLHLSLVHGKKVEIKTKAKSNLSESELDEEMSEDHRGNNSYKCEICHSCFKLRGNLKKHVAAIHKEQKPFKCEICDYSCSRKQNLKFHVDSVQGNWKPFKL